MLVRIGAGKAGRGGGSSVCHGKKCWPLIVGVDGIERSRAAARQAEIDVLAFSSGGCVEGRCVDGGGVDR